MANFRIIRRNNIALLSGTMLFISNLMANFHWNKIRKKQLILNFNIFLACGEVGIRRQCQRVSHERSNGEKKIRWNERERHRFCGTHTKNTEIIILFRWFWLRKGFTRMDCFHFQPAQQSIKTVENCENICKRFKTKKKCFMKR